VTPGSFVRVKRGLRSEAGRFFTLSDFWDPQEQERLAKLTPSGAVDAVEEKLTKSIRMQLRADAPLGAFCSGGVDSSLIAAIASKMQGGLTIFHSNIVGKCSEYEAAKALAGHLGAEFIAKNVTDADYLDRIPDTVRYAEFPYRHLPTSTPFLMLSECARERGVKGLLTGEASDEAFLGYPHYAPNLFKLIPEFPKNTLRLLKNLIKGRPIDPGAPPAAFAGQFHQRFQTGIEKDDIYRALLQKKNGKLKQEDLLSLYDFTDNIRALTHRNDSMGMAAGIETRFPFLDSEVIRTGINLPSAYKLRLSASTMDPAHPFIRDKWVIRKLADRYLPRKLSRRVKTPWPTTFLERMRVSPKFFEGGCLSDWLQLSGREITYCMERAPQSFQTTLMYLEVWAHVCFYQKPKEEIHRKIREHVRIVPEGSVGGFVF
jgi:asparagine synthase (glutamine-hydrolysing)